MSFLNPQKKEINCKIVYYGPPFSGKTTNLRQIAAQAGKGENREIVTLAEGEDRTLFFDFLPLSLGKVKGYTLRLHLYTVPGQKQFDANRKILLKGVDGVVFVADSQVEKLEDNIASWNNLRVNLLEHQSDLLTIPLVLQCNKRDLKNLVPVAELRSLLNGRDAPHLEAVAVKGTGVMESLHAVAKQVLINLQKS